MARYRLPVAAILVLVLGALTSRADEPGWTEAERAERSTTVFTGQVRSIARVEALNEREDLYRAVVTVGDVTKGPEMVGTGEMALYFERPTDGQLGKRCPQYVALQDGQRATFYVRLRKIGTEWRAFLEMGSDVREPVATPAE